MSWMAVGAGAASLISGYASSQAQSKSQKKAMENETKAQKELAAQKRQWQLEDRKYNQDAVGSWAKYLDPELVGPTVGQGSQTSADTTSVTPQPAASNKKSDKAITDPNDPLFAPNPIEKAQNAIPLMDKYRRPQAAPESLWFKRQFPDYDPNNPTGKRL